MHNGAPGGRSFSPGPRRVRPVPLDMRRLVIHPPCDDPVAPEARRLGGPRQIQPHGRTAAFVAVDCDAPAGLLHEVADHA